jgi:hypothetical protein
MNAVSPPFAQLWGFTSLLSLTEEIHWSCQGLAFVPLIFIGPLTRSDALGQPGISGIQVPMSPIGWSLRQPFDSKLAENQLPLPFLPLFLLPTLVLFAG